MERCLFEISINSVCISIKLQSNELSTFSIQRFAAKLVEHADESCLFRRVTKEGYDLSILISASRVETHGVYGTVDTIMRLLQKLYDSINQIDTIIAEKGDEIAQSVSTS